MNEGKELVSVILPCFNQAKYLPDALNSVLNQSYRDWECIIINDGSTDNTEEVVCEWLRKDARFKYISTSNKGPSASRNTGLNRVSGDYVQFLDGDDIIDLRKFELQIEILNETQDIALSICDYYKSTEYDLKVQIPGLYITPRFRSKEYLSELIINWESKLSIPIHCFLFKSNIFKVNKIRFNEELKNHVDWECWMNIFNLNPEVKYLDLKLATYRFRSEGRITNNKKELKRGFLQAISIQKEKFSKNELEYELLERKFNCIKYGTYSSNFVIIFISYVFNNVWHFIRKTINFLIKRLRFLFLKYYSPPID